MGNHLQYVTLSGLPTLYLSEDAKSNWCRFEAAGLAEYRNDSAHIMCDEQEIYIDIEVYCIGAYPLCSALRGNLLNPIKLAYDECQLIAGSN